MARKSRTVSLTSQQLERELLDWIAGLLECETVHEARVLTLECYAKWFHLTQALWVAEPRNMNPEGALRPALLHALVPVTPQIIASQIIFRPHNPVLKIILEDPDRGPLSPRDVMSGREWEMNAFRAEVCAPLGLKAMKAFQVDEGDDAQEMIYTPVLSRDGRDFSEYEILWLERTRWILKPHLAHLRRREARQARGAELLSFADLSLTAKEQEVFHWLCQGKRNKEIAQILDRSPRTVEKHVQVILRKTKTETRTAAARQL